MKIGILKEAIAQCEKSLHKQRVGAVIFKGSRIISTGFNDKRNSERLPNQFRKYIDSLCAEKRAILNARRNLKGCSMLVVRIRKNGELALAKPCKSCQGFIDHVGIRKVYFSNNKGEIVGD